MVLEGVSSPCSIQGLMHLVDGRSTDFILVVYNGELLRCRRIFYHINFVIAVTDAEPPILEPQMEPSGENQLPQQHASTSSN